VTIGVAGTAPRAEAQGVSINFQPSAAPTVSGYLVDSGATYAPRNGRVYGWTASHTSSVFDRNHTSDQLRDTLVKMLSGGKWEIDVTAGRYEVTLISGDGPYSSNTTLNVEGTNYWTGHTQGSNKWRTMTKVVEVVDGKLTVDCGSAPAGTPINALVASSYSWASFILDNTTPDRVTVGGSWTTATSPTGYHGANFLSDGNAGKGSKNVTFTPRIEAGMYEVFLRWPAAGSHANNVPVDVAHAGGVTPLSVNQQANGGQWVSLGIYSFNTGTAGYVRISNAGTTGTVAADAVRFVRSLDNTTDQAKLANGLASWRKPDGNGISCAECHGPAGFDVAQFNFSQADLRRATAPHLTDADADKIHAMLLMWQNDYYPPEGGAKSVASFRPVQPNNTLIGANLTGSLNPDHTDSIHRKRDAEFAIYMRDVLQLNIATQNITTLAQARTAINQLAALDVGTVSVGIDFNLWSRSVSREGNQTGGRFDEWIASVGRQVTSANATEWTILNDAYIVDPSDTNFWAMYHKLESFTQPDPHNKRSTTTYNWNAMELHKFESNLLFAHDGVKRSLGQLGFVVGRDGVRPYQDQEGKGGLLTPFWDVGEAARSADTVNRSQMPRRHEETYSFNASKTETQNLVEAKEMLRPSWHYMGWMMDNGLRFSGPSNSTIVGEYLINKLWEQNLRVHQVFFNAVHNAKLGYKAGCWSPGSADPQHFTAPRSYYLAYGKYQKSWDASGYTGSGTLYRKILANDLRSALLVHADDITAIGNKIYEDRQWLLDGAASMRDAMNWAEPANSAVNDAIYNNYVAKVNAATQY